MKTYLKFGVAAFTSSVVVSDTKLIAKMVECTIEALNTGKAICADSGIQFTKCLVPFLRRHCR